MRASLNFTREGRRFLFTVVLIAVAALITGNNLIYLILSLMVSLLVVAVTAAAVNLLGVSFGIRIEGPVHAGCPVPVRTALLNAKRFSSYSVSVALPHSLPHFCFPAIRPGSSRVAFRDTVFTSRGRFPVREILVRTGFPFIFLTLQKRVAYEKEITVYPALADASELIGRLLPVLSEGSGGAGEGDFFSMREYVYGDECRRIDWKASARTQKTMVRELAGETGSDISIILDTCGRSSPEAFESAVSLAASLSSEFMEQGFCTRLMTCCRSSPFGNDPAHREMILDMLAGAGQENANPGRNGDTGGMGILILSSDTPGFMPDQDWCAIIDARHVFSGEKSDIDRTVRRDRER